MRALYLFLTIAALTGCTDIHDEPTELRSKAGCEMDADGICMCGGFEADASFCGCEIVDGSCDCEGVAYPPSTCGCAFDPVTGQCKCDGMPTFAVVCEG